MQLTVFLDNYPNNSLQNKPKSLKQILTKRCLWKNQAPKSCAFFLECLTSYNCPNHNLSLNDDYYA